MNCLKFFNEKANLRLIWMFIINLLQVIRKTCLLQTWSDNSTRVPKDWGLNITTSNFHQTFTYWRKINQENKENEVWIGLDFTNQCQPLMFMLFLFKMYFTETICKFQRDPNSDCRSRRQSRWPLYQNHCHDWPICLMKGITQQTDLLMGGQHI